LAPPGSDLSGLSELVAQVPGRPLSREAVRRTLQLIDDTGRFENVLAYLQFEPGGAVLLLQLVPKLRILAIAFDGNRRFSDGALKEKLELRTGDEFTPERVQAAASELQVIYRRAGYQDVQVSWTSSRSPVQASVVFRIEEGRPVAIRRVEIAGSPALPSARLHDTLALAPGTTLDADRIDESLKRIEALYRREGRYLAEVGPATTTQVSAGLADVVVSLRAGPRFELSFLDNRTFSDRRLRREMDYEGEGKLDDVTLQRIVERL
jgi:outer membrane protein insertion porin family